MTDTNGHPDTGQVPAGTTIESARPADLSAGPVHPGVRRTGESRLGIASSWAVLVAGFGLSASTWIALAMLSGFDGQVSVPTMSGYLLTLKLAWLMPICIDGYVVTALVLWTSPVPPRVAAFARKNTYGAAGGGVLAQSAYHCLATWTATGAVWRASLALVVGAAPPLVSALAVHMRALIRRESGTVEDADTPSVSVQRPEVADRTPDTSADTAEPDTTPAMVLLAIPDSRTVTADSVPAIMADTAEPELADTDRTPEPADADSEPTPIHTPEGKALSALFNAVTRSTNVTPIANGRRRTGQVADVSVETLADTLGREHGSEYVGLPKALATLQRVHGSCSRDRAKAAKDIHNDRREPVADAEDDPDRAVAAAR